VNWKCLPEEVFISKQLAFLLLACHLGALGVLACKWWNASTSQRGESTTREWLCWKRSNVDNIQLTPEYIIYTMFVANFIGIAFARTLHYQFYCWYFYSLPMLHWIASSTKNITRTVTTSVIATAGVEYAFNVFPATEKSSMILQLSHAFLLTKIFQSEVPSIVVEEQHKKKSQ
jgi:alpha-1,3-mannosyltransferase